MAKTLAVVSALAATALARVTGNNAVHHVFIPEEFQDQELVGSIVTAVPTVTEYRLQCNPTAAVESCNLGVGASVTMRPGDYEFNLEDGDDFTLNEVCIVDRSSAICIRSADGLSALNQGVATTTKTDGLFSMVTITGGFHRATDPVELRVRQLLEEEEEDDCSASESFSHPVSSSSTTSKDDEPTDSPTGSYSTSGAPTSTKGDDESSTMGPTDITSVYPTDIPVSTTLVPHDPQPTGDVTETSTNVVTVTPSGTAPPASTTIPIQGDAARPGQNVVLTGFAALIAGFAVVFL